MTFRLLLAALIAGIGAALPWADAAPAPPDYLSRHEATLGVPMKWLMSVMLIAVLGDPAAAQDSPAAKPKVKRQPNVIVVEEIDAIRTEVNTARDLVQRLRPGFLRNRGASSFGNAASGTPTPTARVVVDGTPRVGVGALAEISAMMVREIRYLNAADASIQFGTGYDGGAILVFTR